MPLTLYKNINADTTLAVWNILEPDDFFFDKLNMHQEESKEFEKITHPQKKTEWLSTRFLTKKICNEMKINYSGIEKDIHKKPYVKNQKINLSISHAYPWVAIIIHKKLPVGIDIETIRQNLHKIKHKFLNNEELTQTVDNNPLKLQVYWSAKEAVYKWLGKSNIFLKENIYIEHFNPMDMGKITGIVQYKEKNHSVKVAYSFTKNYCLCYTLS